MASFLEFLDSNSRPNDLQAGSYNTQFFHPKFTRIASPRAGEKYDQKIALHPSMTDYCATCKHLKKEIYCQQAINNRLHQSGSTSENDLLAYEEAKLHLEEEMKHHKEVATKAREYYKSCTGYLGENHGAYQESLSPSERDELQTQKHCFTLTISEDYQH